MNENRNVVSLEKRRHDRNLGLRLWEQHSDKSHSAWSALWPGSAATHRQLSEANAAESSRNDIFCHQISRDVTVPVVLNPKHSVGVGFEN